MKQLLCLTKAVITNSGRSSSPINMTFLRVCTSGKVSIVHTTMWKLHILLRDSWFYLGDSFTQNGSINARLKTKFETNSATENVSVLKHQKVISNSLCIQSSIAPGIYVLLPTVCHPSSLHRQITPWSYRHLDDIVPGVHPRGRCYFLQGCVQNNCFPHNRYRSGKIFSQKFFHCISDRLFWKGE